MNRVNPWADALDQNRHRVAFLDEFGRETSYRELHEDAIRFLHELGDSRQLVFLEAANTAISIGAYVGCLLAGHVVYLFHGQDGPAFDALVEKYHPNAIVRVSGGTRVIDRRYEETPTLHPRLRLLLATSGSTGSAKFVKLSETNIVSNALSIAEYLDIGPTERAATSLRFNYSYGISVVNSHLIKGASLLLTERSVTDRKFWELFRGFSATSFAGVPHTYESLARMEDVLSAAPSLRYATQAGGRLDSTLVRHFAKLSAAQGWRFYVMYGQTEAAPRMAYLPPEMTHLYPDAIGKPIPGGRIDILDDSGAPITEPGCPGQLVYSGPNVMLGYAENRAALATEESPQYLLTGDIAQWNEAQLVCIVGRAARFVKPFGLRVNLDEIEAQLRELAPGAVCAGTDDMIVIARQRSDGPLGADMINVLSVRYNLPAFIFRVMELDEIPRLANGKVAYRTIVDAARTLPATPRSGRARAVSVPTELILARNQIITLLVSGLWHGAAWTFVSWGLFHGFMLVGQRQVSRVFRGFHRLSLTLRRTLFISQIALVFALVAISRIFFRAETLADAGIVFSNLMHGPYNWRGVDGKATLAVCAGIIALVMTVETFVETGTLRRALARRRVLRTAFAIGALLTTLLIGEFTGGRFIYVRF